MKARVFHFLELLFASLFFWVLAFLLFFMIRYNGIEEELLMFVDEPLEIPLRDLFFFAILIGLIIGCIYAISEFLFDVFLSKRLAIIVVLLVKSIIYFILVIATLSWVSLLVEEAMDIDISNDRGWWVTDPTFWNTVVYFIVASLVFSFLKIAREKFGGSIFFKMLLGTYRKPKEEERILMFLDLKDSTKIAENLGHQKYSQFIQDCFVDLNALLNRFGAEVYQYVGDEAVISWTFSKGFTNNNCINLFNGFKKKLQSKTSYYNTKYNFFPEFKAGMHYGKLMVAEVGTVKKELAFHGDVINTASRIQKLCSRFNEELLISKSILDNIKISETHYKLLSEDIELRGKVERLEIYALQLM